MFSFHTPISHEWGCESSRRLFDEGYPGKVPGKVTMFTKGSQPPSDAPARKPEKARGRPAGGLPDPRSHAEPGSNRDLANENRHLHR